MKQLEKADVSKCWKQKRLGAKRDKVGGVVFLANKRENLEDKKSNLWR